MGQIVDSSYFKDPEYAIYRQPGNMKIPFWRTGKILPGSRVVSEESQYSQIMGKQTDRIVFGALSLGKQGMD
jgi:hypothetical protein